MRTVLDRRYGRDWPVPALLASIVLTLLGVGALVWQQVQSGNRLIGMTAWLDIRPRDDRGHTQATFVE